MKHIKYLIIFLVTLLILFCGLVLSAKIPKESIQKNMEESVKFFETHSGVEEIQSRREYTYLHLYADSVILNLIYCVNPETPVQAVLEDRFYKNSNMDINNDFIELVKENKEPNNQYLRYWHGSMLVLRPLLVLLNIEQIYLLNIIVISTLTAILLILLWKKSRKLAIIFLISAIMVALPVTAMCLEYVWMFYIMLIVSIIGICIEKKDTKLYSLFLITGMVTCFLDFLTTEIITLFVPLLLILIIRKEENRITSFKEGLIFVIKCSIVWAIGYVGMWLAKWLLATIVLKINAMDYVKNEAMTRINGLQGLKSYKEMYLGAITNNLHALYPINAVKRESHLKIIAIGFFIFIIAITNWEQIKKQWFSGLILMIGIMPYLRYLVLANHSFRHSMFTFRSQIITIIAILYAILETSYIKSLICRGEKKWN